MIFDGVQCQDPLFSELGDQYPHFTQSVFWKQMGPMGALSFSDCNCCHNTLGLGSTTAVAASQNQMLDSTGSLPGFCSSLPPLLFLAQCPGVSHKMADS